MFDVRIDGDLTEEEEEEKRRRETMCNMARAIGLVSWRRTMNGPTYNELTSLSLHVHVRVPVAGVYLYRLVRSGSRIGFTTRARSHIRP
jgi:hypothetical protein